MFTLGCNLQGLQITKASTIDPHVQDLSKDTNNTDTYHTHVPTPTINNTYVPLPMFKRNLVIQMDCPAWYPSALPFCVALNTNPRPPFTQGINGNPRKPP